MSLPRYPEYENSGVTWLGEVPAHWKIKRLKHCLALLTEKVESCQNKIALENIQSWSGQFLPSDTEFEGDGVAFQQHDILFGKLRPYLAKVYLADSPGEAVGDFHVMRPLEGVIPRYAQYQILNRVFIDLVDGSTFGSKMPRAGWEFVGNMPFPLPETYEQTTIASFLDRETAKIDGLIAEQEKLITLLAEKRQATISHAVTKGLNPDAPVKNSGAEWLGKVPTGWNCFPVKRLFRLVVEPAPEGNDEELLSIYTDIGVRPRKSLEAKGNKATTTDGYWRVKKGDIIVNKLLAWMGAIGLSDYDGVTSPAYDILRGVKPLHPKFFDYLFRCGIMFTEFRRYSRGIMDMRLRLYFEELGQIIVPFPPLDEQRQIIEFLDQEAARADALSTAATHSIDLLKERRSALISAAVTGKIDVRHLAEAA